VNQCNPSGNVGQCNCVGCSAIEIATRDKRGNGTMSILETCVPRKDLVEGRFNPEIFTANLMQVIDHYRGEADVVENIYTDPPAFFSEGTCPTEGIRRVLRIIFGRLKGKDATYPAIQRLETAFGGGKTHSLIAATHLAYRGSEIADLAKDVIDPALLLAPGAVTVVGIAGDRVAIHETKGSRLIPYTLWGEIAFQIEGESLYQAIGAAATSFGSPGDEYFDTVLKGRKVLIMLDELAAYAARVEAARPGGTVGCRHLSHVALSVCQGPHRACRGPHTRQPEGRLRPPDRHALGPGLRGEGRRGEQG
jgi:hypothetical protein